MDKCCFCCFCCFWGTTMLFFQKYDISAFICTKNHYNIFFRSKVMPIWNLVHTLLLGHFWCYHMFLIRTHTCIVRKVFCSEKIIWSVARTISLRDLFKIFRKHYFRQRDILIWTAGSPCNTPHNSFYSAKENCLINQYF